MDSPRTRHAAFIFIMGAAAASRFDGPVSLTDSTVTFRHSNYDTNYDGSLAFKDHNNIVGTEYNVKVIENDLVKATVLPDYGTTHKQK
jgi:hypothetical protein